jgi:hypothetical protein
VLVVRRMVLGSYSNIVESLVGFVKV